MDQSSDAAIGAKATMPFKEDREDLLFCSIQNHYMAIMDMLLEGSPHVVLSEGIPYFPYVGLPFSRVYKDGACSYPVSRVYTGLEMELGGLWAALRTGVEIKERRT